MEGFYEKAFQPSPEIFGSVIGQLNQKEGSGKIKEKAEGKRMAEIKVECPYYGSKEVSLYGKTALGDSGIYAETRRVTIRHFRWNTKIKPVVQEQEKRLWKWQ